MKEYPTHLSIYFALYVGFFFPLKSRKNLLLQFSLPYKFETVLNFASFLPSSCSNLVGLLSNQLKTTIFFQVRCMLVGAYFPRKSRFFPSIFSFFFACQKGKKSRVPPRHINICRRTSVYFLTITDAEIDWEKTARTPSTTSGSVSRLFDCSHFV